MMKSPEVKEALTGKSDDEELEELLAAIEITDDDDLNSLSKKQQAQMTKVVKYFTKKVANAEKNAVDTATKDTREKEAAAIREFSATHPGMKNQDVVDMMQLLYDKGKSLEDAYAAATKAAGLDPATGEAPIEETPEEKKEREAKEAKAKAEKGDKPASSAKSTIPDDSDVPPDGEQDGEGGTPVTLDEALAASSAAYIAKHGNPFEEQKE